MRILRIAPLLAGVITALCLAPVALAHAHYVTSSPGNGARLAVAPSSVVITYDDNLDPNATVVHVVGPSGNDVTAGKTVVTIEATKVATVPISAAGNGVYTVNWHAVADDDKGVTEGTFAFNVGATATGAAAAAATTTTAAVAVAAPASPAMPASGGGGMALRGVELQSAASLLVALVVALAVTIGLRQARP